MKRSFFLFIAIIFGVSCTPEAARKPISKKTSSFIKTSVAFNKAVNASEEMAIKALIKKDSLYSYTASSHGFWYKQLQNGEGLNTASTGDMLYYTCEIYTLAHEIIYSKEALGTQKYILNKQEIIEGLRNGLQLMHQGDEWVFLFPSYQAYGFVGDTQKIGINQPLIYKVQLNKITKKNENN